MREVLLALVFILEFLQMTLAQYKVPNPKLEILPNGFRVSIPDSPKIKNVTYNINRNKGVNQFLQGEFSARIFKPTNGSWVYENETKLKKSDKVIIWTIVKYDDKYIQTTGYVPAKKIYEVSDKKQISENVCKKSITIAIGDQKCKGQLIFEENFNSLNETIWKHEVRLPGDISDGEFMLYDGTCDITNGLLNIKPILWNEYRPYIDIKQKTVFDLGNNCTFHRDRSSECQRAPDEAGNFIMPPLVAPRITTRHSFSFKYGRINIRAKLPQGDWLYPTLQLEPVKNHYGEDKYISGIIRIAFIRGNDNLVTREGLDIGGRRLYGGAVLMQNIRYRDYFMVNTYQESHLSEEFHIYSLTWTDKSLTFEVDGKEYGKVLGGFSNYPFDNYNNTDVLLHKQSWSKGEFMAPLDQEFYISLGLSVGGHGDFPDGCISQENPKPWRNTDPKASKRFYQFRSAWGTTWLDPSLYVDYVRVYAI